MEICAIKHHAAKFTASRERRTMTAEMSELSEGSARRVFGRVYDDAADEGFVIVNPVTCKEAVFAIHHQEFDKREGDLLWIDLAPTQRTLEKIPALRNWTVRVFND